eukprot:1161548-Pelagomonas_calceolata.AAC.8
MCPALSSQPCLGMPSQTALCASTIQSSCMLPMLETRTSSSESDDPYIGAHKTAYALDLRQLWRFLWTLTSATILSDKLPSFTPAARFEGDHNSRRSDFFYNSVACFFHNTLQLDRMLVGGNPLDKELRRLFSRGEQRSSSPNPASASAAQMQGKGALIRFLPTGLNQLFAQTLPPRQQREGKACFAQPCLRQVTPNTLLPLRFGGMEHFGDEGNSSKGHGKVVPITGLSWGYHPQPVCGSKVALISSSTLNHTNHVSRRRRAGEKRRVGEEKKKDSIEQSRTEQNVREQNRTEQNKRKERKEAERIKEKQRKYGVTSRCCTYLCCRGLLKLKQHPPQRSLLAAPGLLFLKQRASYSNRTLASHRLFPVAQN